MRSWPSWPTAATGRKPPSRPCSTACSTRARSPPARTAAATCIRRCSSATTGCWRKAAACWTACSMAGWRRWSRTSANSASWAARTSPNCASCWRNWTMASNELLQGLIETNLAGSAAILLVLALRRPLRRAFGAGVAYAAWALVPLAMLAVLLPAASAPMAVAMPALAMLAPVDAVAGVSVGRAMPDPWAWAAPAWALGALACAAWMAAQQRRFLRGLGGLADRGDGVLVADAAVAGLPAVVGLWRPRIVLPADVQQRYDATERALMLAHERTHVAHGDLFANALAAGLRCLCWFNPLLHAAARRFRDDQELACDQQVVRRHPAARRAYGEAMLKTQLAGGLLPLGCHW